VLEELRLRGLGVIDDARLEFGPGFTAITGETGAGKTMLLTGLGLLLGSRADAALVRPGFERADVEGRLRVDPDSALVRRVQETGSELDDGALLAARSVSAEGRSRAYLGGRGVPVSVLGEIADDLVAVHGQADQRGLLRASVQRGVLDRYAGEPVGTALAVYRDLFARVSTVQARLLEVTSRRRERLAEADALRHGLAEVDAAEPHAGEDSLLRAEIERLAHVEALRGGAIAARAALAEGEPDALTLIATARRALDEVRGRDASLDVIAVRLADVAYLLADVAADLASYGDGLAADPLRLELAQQRLAQLTGLTRKYALTGDGAVDGLIAWAVDARMRLASLDNDDDRVSELSAEHDRMIAELAAAATQLSHVRSTAARRLEDAATAELAALAMPHARIHVVVRHRDDPAGLLVVDPSSGAQERVAFGASGIDDVEILLEAHPGAPARPLHRGASGGELSRIMLAIEVVLAGSDPVPTFVFDEVDAGVGGRAAVELGRRLAALARTAQVIVVTHLPQVAAFADRHLVVSKTIDRETTSTSVHSVDGAERLEELARMLAGLPDSALGRGHAEELLAVAAAAKKVA
jgi:DNA repair protein RecN (Recombination protein N)